MRSPPLRFQDFTAALEKSLAKKTSLPLTFLKLQEEEEEQAKTQQG